MAKFLESDWLFCFISTCKFGSFKNPFAMVTSLPELYIRFRRFALLLQIKKVILWAIAAASSWNRSRWVRLDLIFTMRNIYINSNLNPLTKFTGNRSAEFKDITSGIFQMIIKTFPISTRIVISHAMNRCIFFWVWRKVNGNWDNIMIRISQCRGSHCTANTGVRRKKLI